MLRSILSRGLLAGFAAGLLAAVLHFLLVQPVLLEAERYERGELVHRPAMTADHDDGAPAATGDEAAAPPSLAPAFDPRRDSLAALSFGLSYAGIGLLLAAAMAWAEAKGHTPSPRAGLAWGGLGWAAVQLAPALGLPPELPGMAAADLTVRQMWWAATATTTALGLALLAFGRGWPAIAAGLALVVAMHVLGAPDPEVLTGPAPPELATLFAARALGMGLIAWLALGWGIVALRPGPLEDIRSHAV